MNYLEVVGAVPKYVVVAVEVVQSDCCEAELLGCSNSIVSVTASTSSSLLYG